MCDGKAIPKPVPIVKSPPACYVVGKPVATRRTAMIRRALLSLFLVLVASLAQAADINHVARPGDTPAALSKVYHVSVAAILAWVAFGWL